MYVPYIMDDVDCVVASWKPLWRRTICIFCLIYSSPFFVVVIVAKHFQFNWCNLKSTCLEVDVQVRRVHCNRVSSNLFVDLIWIQRHKWQIWTRFFPLLDAEKMKWKPISMKDGKIPNSVFPLAHFCRMQRIRYGWNWRMLIYAIIIERYGNLVMHVTTGKMLRLEMRERNRWLAQFWVSETPKDMLNGCCFLRQTRNDNNEFITTK